MDQILGEKSMKVGDETKTFTWVIPLDKPLEYCPPQNVFNIDEKPIAPDTPLRKVLGTASPVAYGRYSVHTI